MLVLRITTLSDYFNLWFRKEFKQGIAHLGTEYENLQFPEDRAIIMLYHLRKISNEEFWLPILKIMP